MPAVIAGPTGRPRERGAGPARKSGAARHRRGPGPPPCIGRPARTVSSSAAISPASIGPENREALAQVALLGPQPFELLVRLDPLGQGHQPERASELDQRVDQGRGIGRPAHVRHERPVDLQDVHRELAQVGERRVPGAEVVDGDLDAQLLQEVEPGHGGDGVPHERGLGDLEDQQVRVEVVGDQRVVDVVEQLVRLELAHGDVDRDAGVGAPALCQAAASRHDSFRAPTGRRR